MSMRICWDCIAAGECLSHKAPDDYCPPTEAYLNNTDNSTETEG